MGRDHWQLEILSGRPQAKDMTPHKRRRTWRIFKSVFIEYLAGEAPGKKVAPNRNAVFPTIFLQSRVRDLECSYGGLSISLLAEFFMSPEFFMSMGGERIRRMSQVNRPR